MKFDILKIIIITLVLLIGCIIVVFFINWIGYWIYYKPLYSIFKEHFYLPFYLYVLACLILYSVTFLSFFIANVKLRIIPKFIFALIFTSILFIIGIDIFRDFIYINTSKYMAVECNLKTLKNFEENDSRMRHYTINSMEKIDGKHISLRMDIFQYNELLKKKSLNENIKILVYYLPNTKRILKYE